MRCHITPRDRLPVPARLHLVCADPLPHRPNIPLPRKIHRGFDIPCSEPRPGMSKGIAAPRGGQHVRNLCEMGQKWGRCGDAAPVSLAQQNDHSRVAARQPFRSRTLASFSGGYACGTYTNFPQRFAEPFDAGNVHAPQSERAPASGARALWHARRQRGFRRDPSGF